MDSGAFHTPDGVAVTAVTAAEMGAVDRIAVEAVGLSLLQMMENAGRNLANQCRRLRTDGSVLIVAGAGGNGGGGLACARHLTNRDIPTAVVLDRDPSELEGATATQHRILDAAGVPTTTELPPLDDVGLVVDALIGYGLQGAPRGRAAGLIETLAAEPVPTLSLDVPSGVDATTGETPGVVVEPAVTLTLALPKTGLRGTSGELLLADIGIPPAVYRRLDVPYDTPFSTGFWVRLQQ
ncbi:MAG: NAD(P)H-hydrate epimerase [Halobacteriales archaeon]